MTEEFTEEDFEVEEELSMGNEIKDRFNLFEAHKRLDEITADIARKHVDWLLETSGKYNIDVDKVSDLFYNALTHSRYHTSNN